MTDTKKPAKRKAGRATPAEGWTAEEKAAMKEHNRELKAARSAEEAATELLAKIAEMPEPDRGMAERIHAVVMESAPDLAPKTWYGMPAYYREGQAVCFFQPAAKFKARYATFGFNDSATLDDGAMWATSWALTKLTAEDEKKIGELVKKAVS